MHSLDVQKILSVPTKNITRKDIPQCNLNFTPADTIHLLGDPLMINCRIPTTVARAGKIPISASRP